VYDFAAKYQGIYTNSFPAVTFNYRWLTNHKQSEL
jgi:hypothetical protein